MPFTVTKQYPQGTFCWADVMSTDAAATKAFLLEIFPWQSQDMPTDQGIDYTMFTVDGHAVAGLSQMPPDMKDVPAYWSSYVAVDDVDEMVAKAEKLGAKIVMPTMDVMKAGRMAGIQDPEGAMLMLWQAGEHIGAGLVNTIGAMGWNELQTRDLKTAKKFYSDLFGWRLETDDTAGYTTIFNNDRMNGGMLMIKPGMGEMPANWMAYFTVEDVEKTLKKVEMSGGTSPSGVIDAPGVGQMAVVQGPAGAVLTVIQLATEPHEWIE